MVEMADAEGVDRAVLVRVVHGRMVADMDRALAAGDMTPGQHAVILRGMDVQAERMVTIRRGEPWILPTEGR